MVEFKIFDWMEGMITHHKTAMKTKGWNNTYTLIYTILANYMEKKTTFYFYQTSFIQPKHQ